VERIKINISNVCVENIDNFSPPLDISNA